MARWYGKFAPLPTHRIRTESLAWACMNVTIAWDVSTTVPGTMIGTSAGIHSHWLLIIHNPHPLQILSLSYFGMTGTVTTGGLDEMTSAKDFQLISWKNGLGLSGIVVAVLIPVGLRYYWRADVTAIQETAREEEEAEETIEGDSPASSRKPGVQQLELLSDSESEDEEEEEVVPVLVK